MNRDSYLYAACEALWRDAKYAVMRKSYSAVQRLQKELQKARWDAEALQVWMHNLLDVYNEPEDGGADTNTLYHVMGYLNDDWPDAERQRMHRLAQTHRALAWGCLTKSMAASPHPCLLSSYVWRTDAWSTVWFWYKRAWHRFQVAPSRTESLPYRLEALEEWHRHTTLRADPLWLAEQRLGVFLDQAFFPYAPLPFVTSFGLSE